MTQPTGKKTGYIELENGGTIKIEFYPDSAPKHVANFEKLANSGFYNGLTFHRVEPGFVVQGGDPSGNGTGGPGWKVPAEFNDRKHVTGTVAMARSQDPNSAGSQFYICLAPAPFLDKNYTVFGQVLEGQDLVQKIRKGDKMKTVKVVDE
jgi:peptidyl-prolyl cis-trans isomerase B (cyclophilin B)